MCFISLSVQILARLTWLPPLRDKDFEVLYDFIISFKFYSQCMSHTEKQTQIIKFVIFWYAIWFHYYPLYMYVIYIISNYWEFIPFSIEVISSHLLWNDIWWIRPKTHLISKEYVKGIILAIVNQMGICQDFCKRFRNQWLLESLVYKWFSIWTRKAFRSNTLVKHTVWCFLVCFTKYSTWILRYSIFITWGNYIFLLWFSKTYYNKLEC